MGMASFRTTTADTTGSGHNAYIRYSSSLEHLGKSMKDMQNAINILHERVAELERRSSHWDSITEFSLLESDNDE